MELVKEREKKAYEILKDDFGYKNQMESPRVKKVVISTGIGSINEKRKIELIPDRLARITGQKPAPRPAKKSIASFKVREGQTTGFQVTLRGNRMYSFLDKLFAVALPRTRDFRGIPRSAVDDMGNLSIGIKEHTIFPETSDEELRDVFGMSITLVTSAQEREEAIKFLEFIGIPFKKEESKDKKKEKH